jgi:hypothetical protein
MRTVIVALMLVAGTLGVAVAPAQAYYDDIHYALTYYIARTIGCTPEQSYRLASANVSVDWSPPTEPVQGIWPTTATQEPRAKFHAMRDETRFPGSIGDGSNAGDGGKNAMEADRAIRDQSVKLLVAGIDAKNPGVFLHFFQDREPHARYGTRGGHWVDTLDTLVPNPFTFPPVVPMNLAILFQHFPGGMGGTTDWLSFQHQRDPARDPAANARLVRQTAEILATAMRKIYGVSEGRPCLRALPPVSEDMPVLAGLRAANPFPKQLFPKDLQYVKAILDLCEKPNKTPQEQEQLRQALLTDYGKHKVGPDMVKALGVIKSAMGAAGMVEGELRAEHRQYQLNGEGQPSPPEKPTSMIGACDKRAVPVVGDRNLWTLVGTLRVKVGAASSAGGQITVKAPRTQTSETEYVMAQAAMPAPGGAVEFKNMPIGQLIVEVPGTGSSGCKPGCDCEGWICEAPPPGQSSCPPRSRPPTACAPGALSRGQAPQQHQVLLDKELVEVVIGGQNWRW